MDEECACCKDPSYDGADDAWALLARQGFTVQPVLGDGLNPGFAYTVGLTLLDHPELLIYGTPWKSQVSLLNRLAVRVKEGERFTSGQLIRDLTPDSYDFTIIDCTPYGSSQHLLMAIRMLSVDGNLAARQLVWPDAANLFPWQPGYDRAKCPQPLLGPPPDARAG